MTRLRHYVPALVLVALLTVFSVVAIAQETTGSISGTITDSSGASVKGAAVTLTNTDRGQDIRKLTTNSAGFYTATSLPLGTYSVKVAGGGFKSEVVTGLVLHANDALTVNRTLVVGNTNETVTVTADQVQLNLEDATSAGLINATQINELVLGTRNYEQLLNLQPGVAFGGAGDQLYVGPTNPSGGSNQVNFSVNGGRNTSNNWTIDGSDNVDRGANLTLLTFPSVDAIAEFKTLRGQYSAEFGRSASGQINVITKSGTNSIHGSAYEFIRNDILNANGYFNNLTKVPRPKYRYNDFGFSFGGPVYIPKIYNGHDKTFFFVSEEFRRFVNYSSGAALVPTAAERAGDFTNDYYQDSSKAWHQGPVPVCTAYNPTTGICTASGTTVTNISPTAKAYLKDIFAGIPAPQSATDLAAGIDPHTLNSTIANIFNNVNSVVRIDQQFGQKLSVFYRYMHDTFPTFQGSGTFVAVPIPGLSATVTNSPGTQHLGHVTYILSPTMLANIGYAYSNGTITTVPQGSLQASQSPDIAPTLPYANLTGVVPTISFNLLLTTIGGAAAYDDHDINHNAFGNVTKTFHTNTVIVGASYNHFYKKENNNVAGNQGSFTFNNDLTIPQTLGATSAVAFSNFLLGNANSGFSQASTAQLATLTENILEAYVQDNWKATPRLSLNLGVRYGYYGQPSDGLGRLSNFDPDLYSASKAPTIDATGRICLKAPCAGVSAGPNPNTDFVGVNYLNGYIFGGNTPNGHVTPFGNGKIGNADNLNFAPRFGFAYDVFGDGKTAFRGGYGWSYDQSEVSFYESQTWAYPPPTGSCSASPSNLDNPTPGCPANTPSITPGRVLASPINYHTPYIQQYSLDIQQAITPTFMLDVGYFGTHGTHLLGLIDINESQPGAYVGKVSPLTSTSGAACILPGTGGTTGIPAVPAFVSTACDQPLNQIKPYLGYFSVDAVRAIFSSNYNSLQVKATKRFSGKTYIDANYTWSRALTNNQNDYSTPPQNTYNINADYGRAAVDRTNILTLDGVYELPWYREQKNLTGRLIGGWEVSVIYAINSGLPLTASASTGGLISYGFTNPLNGSTSGGYVTDNAGLGIAGNTNAGFRPDMIGDPNSGNGRPIHNRLNWFNVGAFAAPPVNRLTPGNEKRGVINGPGFNRADVGIFRNFRIVERLQFQFRAEAFNVANHTNWQTVGTTSTTASSFGQITGNRDARLLQFAGKFTF
jgi:hypothetical protein